MTIENQWNVNLQCAEMFPLKSPIRRFLGKHMCACLIVKSYMIFCANVMSIENQWNANVQCAEMFPQKPPIRRFLGKPLQINCQLTTNGMSINFQLNAIWLPIEFYVNIRHATYLRWTTDTQYDANLLPIDYQLVNWSRDGPIECHLRSKTLNWEKFRIIRLPL